jgi:Hypervirulence associated proteins TUDOR domain
LLVLSEAAGAAASTETSVMARTFRVGDHVSWNSEAGRVRGHILRVHKKDVIYKGYVHHADTDDPQYEIKSDKTDHVALHKGRALRPLSR